MDDREFDVLVRAHLAPFKTKSDFARLYATEVGALASKGYISTWLPGDSFGTEWRPTPAGLTHLRWYSGKYFGDEDALDAEEDSYDPQAGWR